MALLLIFNGLGAQFDDEWDNFVGGLLIGQGRVLYRDIFSHHFPLPYLMSAVYQLFLDRNPLAIRIFYAASVLLLAIGIDRLVGRRDGVFPRRVTFLIYALVGPVLLLQMLLAESIAFYLFGAALVLLQIPEFKRGWTDGLVLALIGGLLILTSQAYVLLGVSIGFSGVWVALKHKAGHRRTVICGLALLTPALVFALYLWMAGAFSDFIYQTVTFNREHYFKFAAGPGKDLNDLLFSIFIRPLASLGAMLLWQGEVSSRLVYLLLALAGLARLVVLWSEGRRAVAFLFGTLWVLSMTRFNPGAVFWEVHNSVALVWPLTALSYLSFHTFTRVVQRSPGSRAVLAAALPLLVGMPLMIRVPMEWRLRLEGDWIPRHDAFASRLERLVPEGQSYWSGPFLFRTIFFTRRNLATRYTFFLPWHGDSRRVTQGMLHDLKRERPAVVLFQGAFATWGSVPAYQYASPIYGFLMQHYVQRKSKRLSDFFFREDLKG
ncbi:MAG: hypothetical protein K1X83_01630 [Oligoflexia bacterium]|nr:hypothetical protein [Oligoflexia bacterium]